MAKVAGTVSPAELAHAARHIRILSDAASSRGAETVLEITAGRGAGLPRHLHTVEDELVWVIAGSLRVTVDDEPPYELGPGDELLLPRGVPHEVRVASEVASWMVVCRPGGIEWFLHATASDDGTPPDWADDDVAAHLTAAGIRVLGAPTPERSVAPAAALEPPAEPGAQAAAA